MLVSIVIPVHNAEDTLERCLRAALEQTYPHTEVIVVDDGSNDASPRIAQALPVTYIRQEKCGPAAARNLGAQAAQGEILAFTDSDCFPEPDWIERLIDPFDEQTAAVGGAYGIANPENRLARIVHEEIRDRHARFADEVDFVGSFNVAYRRTAFEEAGGFDEAFTAASGEDNDLAYRLKDHGGVLRYAKDARVAHLHPAHLGPYLRTQMRHGYWRMKIYAKHPQRARTGDAYAGLLDFAAPPLALALLGTLLAVPFATLYLPLLLGLATLGLILLTANAAIHFPTALRMVRRTGNAALLLYLDVALLRDMARAIGMVRGAIRFAPFAQRKP